MDKIFVQCVLTRTSKHCSKYVGSQSNKFWHILWKILFIVSSCKHLATLLGRYAINYIVRYSDESKEKLFRGVAHVTQSIVNILKLTSFRFCFFSRVSENILLSARYSVEVFSSRIDLIFSTTSSLFIRSRTYIPLI